MDDLETRLYRWWYDEIARTVALFMLAAGLGLVSIGAVFLSPERPPGRFELTLQIAAVTVLFYLSVRSVGYC